MPVDWPLSACCSTTTTAWISWNTTSTSAAVALDRVWLTWSSNTTTVTYQQGEYLAGGYVAPARPVETEEQRQARAVREDELAAKRKARAEQVAAAKVRASELLRSILTDEQWDAWVKDSAFDLTTEAGNRYRIKRGVAGNVVHIKDGKPVETLCIHPATAIYDDERNYLGDMPTEDVIIGQKLLLECDEAEFRRIANISPIRPAYAASRAA